MDICPIGLSSSGVITSGLHFETDKVFEMNDGYKAILGKFDPLRTFEHPESRTPESMKQVDTT